MLAADGVTRITTAKPAFPAAAASSVAGPGCVDIVYFEENGGATGPRGLYDLVSATGISSLRSSVTAAGRLFSLAVDSGGVVYGIDPLSDNLYLVDLNSGSLIFLVTLVGTSTVADISFDPISGQLYGCERNSPYRLYTIDPGSGVVTIIGTMASVRTGLAFAPSGLLYGCSLSGTLFLIDPATAAETLIGGGGGPALLEDATVRADGTIFVTDFSGGLFSIDPATGANTLIGNSGLGTGLLGIVPDPLAVSSAQVVRVGAPANPVALMPGVSSGPVIGTTWDPVIDHSSFFPTALIDVLALSFVPVNVSSPFGTVLCNPDVLFAGVPGTPFQFILPANCSLAGLTFCAQGASTDGVSIVVTNGLDVVVGMF